MNIQHLTGRINPGNIPQNESGKQQAGLDSNGNSFAQILENVSGQQNGLHFSGHAMKRLEERSIQLDEAGVRRLQDAVNLAEKKGSKDSLILDGDKAYVVNVPNRTVVTALDMMELRERVFTNIDSTVFTSTGQTTN